MTRDFNLIREILLQVEKAPSGEPIMVLTLDRDNLDEAVVGEHLQLMIEAGLIEGDVHTLKPVRFILHRLTWSGHDFLENARSDTIWKKVIHGGKHAFVYEFYRIASTTTTTCSGSRPPRGRAPPVAG
jgi:hypothetical protein